MTVDLQGNHFNKKSLVEIMRTFDVEVEVDRFVPPQHRHANWWKYPRKRGETWNLAERKGTNPNYTK